MLPFAFGKRVPENHILNPNCYVRTPFVSTEIGRCSNWEKFK